MLTKKRPTILKGITTPKTTPVVTQVSKEVATKDKPLYSIGLDRALVKDQLKNPYSIGPVCIALPSGTYTQADPLDLLFMEYNNPRFDAYIDKMMVLGADFVMWSKVGFQIRKNNDFWIPNLMTAIKILPDNDLGNWINPPPYWSNMIGFDVKIRTGDALRIKLYNESAVLGYIWLFVVGHYELMEEGEI